MNNINKVLLLCVVVVMYSACDQCEEVEAVAPNNSMDSPYCGWAVTTHYGGKRDPMDDKSIVNDPAAVVGAIYDTRLNAGAVTGTDWGATVPTQVPSSWTVGNVGQVYGVATDSDNNIYLASSDIYAHNTWDGKTLESGNATRPSSCTQIYKCMSPNFDPLPFVSLPSNCEPLNGIGNIAYDYVNNQLLATSLEDGKIYRISSGGIQLGTYDPWSPDDGVAGIAPADERVWGVGVNVEDGVSRVYFARTLTTGISTMYALALMADGSFPPAGSETIAVARLDATQPIISDIAFSIDGDKMLYSEYGDIQSSKIWTYEHVNANWVASGINYYVGSNQGVAGANSAGGVDFGPVNDGADASGRCDDLIWATGKNLKAISEVGDLAGLQAIDYNGNSQYAAGNPLSNAGTDLYIDLDGYYVDPCDLSSSLILNAGFEELTTPGVEPNSYAQLDRAEGWFQATDATSDLFSVSAFPGTPAFINIAPPNGSDHYAGGVFRTLPIAVYEYIGGCLGSPIVANVEHSINLLVGTSSRGGSNHSEGFIDIDLVILGVSDCNFPKLGVDCKESPQYPVIVRIPLDIPDPSWQQVSASFTTNAAYPGIMIGLSCTSAGKADTYHLLVDDIILTQGQPCSGNEVIKDFPGDVELFKCEGCFGPETLNTYIK